MTDPVAAAFRAEQGRILSALLRQFGDWQLAEDALMDAFAVAVERWPVDGVPDRPGAWLLAAGRRKAIDRLRRRQTQEVHADAVARHQTLIVGARGAVEERMEDDRLSLLFTCCHPALAPDARIALTLRYVGGLTTREVSRAFLVPEATMAKRLVRAKHKIEAAGIPYQVPEGDALAPRLAGVCRVIYLVFTEGYAATEGDQLVRRELCEEAIRLTEVLRGLMPDEPEVTALAALLWLTHSRRAARVDADDELVLLDDQDRSLWDADAIARGRALLQEALRARQPGPYLLQACVAELHASATGPDDTDWAQIAALYAALARLTGSAVVRLNHAVAVAFATEPAAGLGLLDAPDLVAALGAHHRFHAARADLLRRVGRWSEAEAAYGRAIELASNEAERRHLLRRRDGLRAGMRGA